MTILHDTSAWIDSLVGTIGELHGQEESELYCRIQLDQLPLVLFKDPEGFSKWVIGLDERDVGKTIKNCYWLESGFLTVSHAVRWAHSKFGDDIVINFVSPIGLRSPIN